MKKITILLMIFLLFLLVGCNTSEKDTDNRKKTVAVSIAPQSTFVSKVCGDKFQVVTAIPTGASPETYEPNLQEIKSISDAEIYFSIGVPAEENLISPIISNKTKTVALHEKAAEIYPDRLENDARDPHIWLSPKRVIVMIETIAETFKEIDPENREFYTQNAKTYIEELTDLDKFITSSLKNLRTNKFISFHSAFGYFADDYSLSQYALEEHGKEATPKRFAQMADLAKKEDIKTVFYQAESSKKQVLSFAEEIGGEAVMLEPLSPNYTENLKAMTNSLLKAMK